jgi:hypothetical protein
MKSLLRKTDARTYPKADEDPVDIPLVSCRLFDRGVTDCRHGGSRIGIDMIRLRKKIPDGSRLRKEKTDESSTGFLYGSRRFFVYAADRRESDSKLSDSRRFSLRNRKVDAAEIRFGEGDPVRSAGMSLLFRRVRRREGTNGKEVNIL